MIDGFLILNKKAGMTSASAINRLKRILRTQHVDFDKIGHTGTLDPDGEGVLPIAIGRATRLFNYISEKTKVYYTEFVFGKETDTLDGSGTVTKTSGIIPSSSDILAVLDSLKGEIDQIPPMYSAKSVNGQRAYDLARAGINVELKPRRVTINSIELLGKNGEAFAFRITCGGGTYIRSIARDMATSLGTFGYMQYIRREQSGAFSIENAYTLEEIEAYGIQNKVIPMETVLSAYPRLDIYGETARLVLNGVPLKIKNMPTGDFTVYADGILSGIGSKNDNGEIHIHTRLAR